MGSEELASSYHNKEMHFKFYSYMSPLYVRSTLHTRRCLLFNAVFVCVYIYIHIHIICGFHRMQGS